MTIPGGLVALMLAPGGVLQETGWTFPTSSGNDASVGTVAWASMANIYADDAVTALVNLTPGITSNYLWGAAYGFNIPTGATIVGIEVRAEVNKGAAASDITDVRIRKADASIGSVNKSAVEALTTTPTLYTYGGPTDLWGEVWAAADINDVDFGFLLSCTEGRPRVDYYQVNIHYIA